MDFNNFLKQLGISPTQKNKLLKRYQKKGIEIINEMISEEDAARIFRETEEYVNLSQYVIDAVADASVNGYRAASDIRIRLVSEGIPVLKFSDTLFSVTPNTSYIHKKFIPEVDRVIAEYLETHKNGEIFIPRIKKPKKTDLSEPDPVELRKREQQETWTGIIDFLAMHPGWDVFVRKKHHRENALFYIEERGGFDLDTLPAEEVLFEKTKNNPYYIRITDIPAWEECMRRFFEEYGLSSEQRLAKISARCEGRDTFVKFEQFLDEMRTKNQKMDRTADAAHVAWSLAESKKELQEMSTREVEDVILTIPTKGGRTLLVMFADWLRKKYEVAYKKILPVYKESSTVDGYSWEQYKALCHIAIYNKHIKEKDMVKKALSDIKCAGMWLYHSIMLFIPIRGTDAEQIICFVKLNEDPNWLQNVPRDADELEKALLEDSISEEDYQMIGKWFIDRIDFSALTISKTQREEVRARVTPTLLGHFGRLFLIGEVHHMRGEERFIDLERWGTSYYCNRMFMKNFYGDEVIRILKNENFQRTKMNHTVLQMEQKAARKMGLDAYTTVSVIAYSRGHTNNNTMYHYIGDHALTGEDAGTVLWLMMERGVLSSIPYLMLLSYFPESFGQMSAEEQTKLMKLSGLTPIEIEAMAAREERILDLKEIIVAGEISRPEEVLKPLMAISQGYGASLDEGCYCLKRAAGMKCDQDVRGKCLSSGCKCEVFTTEAIPAIGQIVREKIMLARNGDRKAAAVLKHNVLPNITTIVRYLKTALPEYEYREVERQLKEEMEVPA